MGFKSSVAAFFKAVFSPDMMNQLPEGSKLLGPRPDKQELHDTLMQGQQRIDDKPRREPTVL